MKYYPGSSWICLTHNVIASIISLISPDIHAAESCQLRHVRPQSATSADNFLTPLQWQCWLYFPFYSQVRGEGPVDSSGYKSVLCLARIVCMLIGKYSVLDFTVNTLDKIFSNRLPPKNVACTFVFSGFVNILEQDSSCSDNSRLDPVPELVPREKKLSS